MNRSDTFTEEELEVIYNLIDTDNLCPPILTAITHASLAVAYGARNIESLNLQWSHIQIITDQNGNDIILVKYKRAKAKEAEKWSEITIRGHLQVKIIKTYMKCFTSQQIEAKDKEGRCRFYRKLQYNKYNKNKIEGTDIVIGKDQFAKMIQLLADTIGKKSENGNKVKG